MHANRADIRVDSRPFAVPVVSVRLELTSIPQPRDGGIVPSAQSASCARSPRVGDVRLGARDVAVLT